MSSFCNTFNPFLNYEILTIIPSSILHEHLRKSTTSLTTTNLLYSALNLLLDEVQRLEKVQGVHHLSTMRALNVLGNVQSELNLHVQAADTFRKIVTIDDMQEHLLLPVTKDAEHHKRPKTYRRYNRNLEALFNLALQLNKSHSYIEAEVALRRLVPHVRTRFGRTSFQYRNSLEQLIYALYGQGCREGVQELVAEYERSQHDEIEELQQLKDLGFNDDDDDDNEEEDYMGDIEMYTDSELESEIETPKTAPLENEPGRYELSSEADCTGKRHSPLLILTTTINLGQNARGLATV